MRLRVVDAGDTRQGFPARDNVDRLTPNRRLWFELSGDRHQRYQHQRQYTGDQENTTHDDPSFQIDDPDQNNKTVMPKENYLADVLSL